MRNAKKQCNNTSGVTGVDFHKETKKWRSMIAVNGKRFHIGYFNDFDEAVLARVTVEKCLDWSNCDSASSAYKYAIKNNLIKRRLKND
jgi:hypothetical protein